MPLKKPVASAAYTMKRKMERGPSHEKLSLFILALVLTLAHATPVLAFTNNTASSPLAPALNLYLVDYDATNDFAMLSVPEPDRAYAKNEIVAAIAEIRVPDGYTNNMFTGYPLLRVSGTDVSLNVNETIKIASSQKILQTAIQSNVYIKPNMLMVNLAYGSLPDNETYKLLFFGKVTGDNPSFTAALWPSTSFAEGLPNNMLFIKVEDVSYYVIKHNKYYEIHVLDGQYADYRARLHIDSKNKTTGMTIIPDGDAEHPLLVTPAGVLGILEEGSIITSGANYRKTMAFYNDVLKDVFELDYYLIGNYLYDSFFIGVAEKGTISTSVSINPLSPYVKAPTR